MSDETCKFDRTFFFRRVDGVERCQHGHERGAEAKPQTWSLPSEPGPEVTALSAYTYSCGYGDKQHFTFRRRKRGGWKIVGDDGGYQIYWNWEDLLLQFEPVTDATHELEEEQ